MAKLDIRGIDTKDVVTAPFPSVRHEFRVHVAEDAFDRIVARGAADTSREVGGVLVGQLQQDEAGPYVVVTAVIDALHAEEKGAELTFTHATWDHIHAEMDGKHQGQRIVGWYHTHPGFGVFLSDRDQFIHRSFFDLPHQVALVHDPKSKETGVFGWRGNEPVRLRRHWVGAREVPWESSPVAPPSAASATAAATAAAAAGPPSRDPASSEPEPLGRWWDVVILSAFVLVALAAGFWLGRRPVADVLQQARVAMLEERSDLLRQLTTAMVSMQDDRIALGEICRTLAAGARREGNDAEARRLLDLADRLDPGGMRMRSFSGEPPPPGEERPPPGGAPAAPVPEP